MKKIIQFQVVKDEDDDDLIYALSENGALFRRGALETECEWYPIGFECDFCDSIEASEIVLDNQYICKKCKSHHDISPHGSATSPSSSN